MELVIVVLESSEFTVGSRNIAVVMELCGDVAFALHAKLFKAYNVARGFEVPLVDWHILFEAKVIKHAKEIVFAIRVRRPIHGEFTVRCAVRRARRLSTIDVGVPIDVIGILGFIVHPDLDVHR